MEIILLLFIFVLAAFLGFELISKVPSQLHTPLMSGSNAISGITIVGALIASGQTDSSSCNSSKDTSRDGSNSSVEDAMKKQIEHYKNY